MQHIAADHQIRRCAWAQHSKVAEAREMKAAARAVALHCIFAVVEAEIAQFRPQFQQRRAPRAFAAADVEHRADRTFEMVFRGGDRQRDFALQPLAPADARIAIPAVEIGAIVGFIV